MGWNPGRGRPLRPIAISGTISMTSGALSMVGTAGWSIARDLAERFPPDGSALQRYASVFSGVEINSSFYRRHRATTWQRWHDSVPDYFRFAVKMPKVVSHELALVETAAAIDLFLDDIAPLGQKLGPLLVQLPPSLAFELGRDRVFFGHLRKRCPGRIVLEPRHVSWASGAATDVLIEFAIDRVYADPALSALRESASRTGPFYVRLHGSPKVYYSAYSAAELQQYAHMLAGTAGDAWCIFDNTASGAALNNALDLQSMLAP